MMDSDTIKNMIEQGLSGAEARVTGDGRHFEAVVISDAFDGKSMLESHRMVYDALGESMKGAIHALSIRTYTRSQWEAASGAGG